MKVFVIASITNDKDLSFRFTTENRPVSKLFTIPKRAQYINGNPYSVYGKIIGPELGLKDYLSMSISVFECISGDLGKIEADTKETTDNNTTPNG